MGLFQRKQETKPKISWPVESKRPLYTDDKETLSKRPLSSTTSSSSSSGSSSRRSSLLRLLRREKPVKDRVISWPIESNRHSTATDGTSVSEAKSQAERALSLSSSPSDTEPTVSTTSSKRSSGLLQFASRRHTLSSIDSCKEIDCGAHDVSPSPSQLPTKEALDSVGAIPIFDEDGNSRPFSSIYDGPNAIGDQQLIIFVRHFFCGGCQAYLKALSANISLNTYFTLPVPTSITIIGLGSPALIPAYRKFTQTPFSIFTDPTRRLHRALGMGWSLSMGPKAKYFGETGAVQWLLGQLGQMKGAEKAVRWRGGAWWWVGGEMLVREGSVVWCNRMRNHRGHVEMEGVKELLGVEESCGEKNMRCGSNHSS